MTKIKETNVDDYVYEMRHYVSEIKKYNKEQSKEILIRTGVLNKDGTPKKKICTGGFYGK